VSGGLLAMNRTDDGPSSLLRDAALFENSAGVYLHAFVGAGLAHAGWRRIVKRYHRLPVAGWGLHLYVSQDTPALAANPWTNFGRYLTAFQDMTGRLSRKHLGRNQTLPTWITELGFGTPLARFPVSDRTDSVRARYWSYEAEGLEVAYQCVAQIETGAPVFWFTLSDVPNAEIESGLFTPFWGTPQFAPLTPKPAADRYRSIGAGARTVNCYRTVPSGHPRRVRCGTRHESPGSATLAPLTGQCREG
jgi:hypothetical protein